MFWKKNEEDEMMKYCFGSTYRRYEQEQEEERKRRRGRIITGCITAAFIVAMGLVVVTMFNEKKEKDEKDHVEISTPESNEVHVNESSVYQENVDIGGGPNYVWYEIGDMEFFEEAGQTNEEILNSEIEEEKASVLKKQYHILLAERRIAACEIELFKEKHLEMSDKEKAELEKMSQEYEAKKSAIKEFKTEHPEVNPPAPTPIPPIPMPPDNFKDPMPDLGPYSQIDPEKQGHY